MSYKKILLAVELHTTDDRDLLKRVKDLMSHYPQAKLYLIHVVEYLDNYALIPSGIDFEAALMKEAGARMKNLGTRYDVPADRQIIKLGSAKLVILEEAKQLGIDLIVVGSHGRHGVSLLLGSTANAVLHGAECDVLAVRVGK